MVTNVSVSPSSKSLTVGDMCYLYETVTPSNATNKTVLWSSSNKNVATVNPNSGLITARGSGTATIYATAQDGSGKRGTCSVSVSAPVSVTSISISPKQKTLSKNENTTLRATVRPCGASCQSVIWSSSNPSVATVGTYTGIVTAKSDGTTTITARAANGNNTDTATIIVDSRERVLVKKDSHSFYVQFADGKVWKNIGIDLTNRRDNYHQLNPPNMWYEYYDYLIEEEQRYFDNIYVEESGGMVYKTYSVKQIAYLYLLDPLGIEYYMRHHACDEMNLGETLLFKDEVYKEIFGVWPRLIEISSNNTLRYYIYQNSISEETRKDYYTDAEVLFGFHNIISWDWGNFIKTFLEGIFGWIMDDSVIGNAVQAYQTLFHAGGILGGCSSYASSYAEDYIKENIENDIQQKLGNKAKKCFNWAFNLVLILADSTFSAFKIPNPKDITIYNRISDIPDYLTIIDEYNGILSMEEIIKICNMNQ